MEEYKTLNDLLVEGLLKLPTLETYVRDLNELYVYSMILLRLAELSRKGEKE